MRMTPARAAICEIVKSSKGPVSAPEILELLKKRKINVNKTTVYRELAFLLSECLVKEVKLSSRVVYYESASLAHHHHLVCEHCGKIEEIICKELEGGVEKLEKSLAKKFEIKEHSLEFFGTCAGCH